MEETKVLLQFWLLVSMKGYGKENSETIEVWKTAVIDFYWCSKAPYLVLCLLFNWRLHKFLVEKVPQKLDIEIYLTVVNILIVKHLLTIKYEQKSG